MSSNSGQNKKNALGRGLGALLQSNDTDITSARGVTSNSVNLLPISSIEANPFNPRTHFEKTALQDLANSIAVHGIIQPLTVRKQGHDKYQLISGERRFRAAQIAGLTEVPAYVRIANDQSMLEMALVENIQREDLNAIEVALSYQRLIDECSLTQEELSEKVAKSRSNIANFLRLLKLPDVIQAGVRDNRISMAHARTLLSFSDLSKQLEMYEKILNENLSVREIEALSKGQASPKIGLPKSTKLNLTTDEKNWASTIGRRFDTKIKIEKSAKGSGKLVMTFETEEDLSRIMSLLEKA
jgi:ParB family transcriptional regulator, chromosome partitioning protein